jgi:hypothetical protein
LNIQNNNGFSPQNRNPSPKGIVSVHPRKTSEYLHTGDQAKLIDAAVLAETWGYPINRLTTIRTEILARSLSGVFAGKHQADGVKCLLELMRHWHKKRGIPWACIWSREVGFDIGGHLHIGTHQSEKHTEAFINQMAAWTGENRVLLKRRRSANLGHSEHQSWLVQCCTRKGQSGPDLASYLGKDERGYITTAWRVKRNNTFKRVLGYTCKGGLVEGTTGAAYRHGTSKGIAPSTDKGRGVLATISDSKRLFQPDRPDLSWLPY